MATSAISKALTRCCVLLLFCATCIHALEVAANSACEAKCATGTAGTTADSIVCLDSEFSQTTNGSHFQQCVECELDSTTVDASTGTPDVLWGLYNLRYALSACMFGFPVQKVGLSSPCQVTCAPLAYAIEENLENSPASGDLSFCNEGNFTSTTVQECVFCYGLMDTQKYLANFLQALFIACQEPPSPTNPFPITAASIFNETAIQPPATSSAGSSGSHSLSGTGVSLAIALPIVFVFLVLLLTCVTCFFRTRRRRREMASRGKMRRVHESWGDSPATPRAASQYNWDQVAMDMDRMQGQQGTTRQSQKYSPNPQYEHNPKHGYRDDVGPGPDQVKDPQLHDRYFATPEPDAIGLGMSTDQDQDLQTEATQTQHHQSMRAEQLNLLHSPVVGDHGQEDIISRGAPSGETHDASSNQQHWI